MSAAPSAVLPRFLVHAGHQEDVVVDPERDQEHEHEQREGGVGSREAEVLEDEGADTEGRGERQNHRGDQDQRRYQRPQQGRMTNTATSTSGMMTQLSRSAARWASRLTAVLPPTRASASGTAWTLSRPDRRSCRRCCRARLRGSPRRTRNRPRRRAPPRRFRRCRQAPRPPAQPLPRGDDHDGSPVPAGKCRASASSPAMDAGLSTNESRLASTPVSRLTRPSAMAPSANDVPIQTARGRRAMRCPIRAQSLFRLARPSRSAA